MASVFDVAAYILAKKGGMTAWKLQKLVYYSQAWSLVWDDRPLFNDRSRLGLMALFALSSTVVIEDDFLCLRYS